MVVYIFGNPDLPEDSLPLRILPRLKEEFPGIDFQVKDPNEEWDDAPQNLVIIDTVQGISEPKVFTSLDVFSAAPRLSLHDFDALANLRLLQKLGKLKKVTVLALPPTLQEADASFAILAMFGDLM